ncbi:DUF4339 domain-containing protein [Rhodopirellula sp. MGV]|uniref:DUF4339 domain-containing protein n=1 Tax=Rhodopirellula sp. MGV TaxID=2023130 RepID=UPI000B974424|nr:DUF4339 domain-containing protein [Rhodopirellula sp. MGV]OYP31035.1 hypothetical protein CGZ80_21940 [Rhodopirellula sp. MGV]PNY34618.1 DUF4339 domain-containing protein [Rhodopirellula baltica]
MTGRSTSNPGSPSRKQQWILLRENNHVGPLTPKQLKHLAETQQITPADLLWREGLQEWIPAKRLPQLWSGTTQQPPESVTRSTPPPIPAPVSTVPNPGTFEPNETASNADTGIPVLQPVGVRSIQIQPVKAPTSRNRKRQSKDSPQLRFRQTGSVIVFAIASLICGILHLPLTIISVIGLLKAPFVGLAALTGAGKLGGGLFAAGIGFGATGLAVISILMSSVYIALAFCCFASGIGLACNRAWGGWFGLAAGACSTAIALWKAWTIWTQFETWRLTEVGPLRSMKENADAVNVVNWFALSSMLFSLVFLLLYGGYAALAFRSILSARYYEESPS